MQLSKTLGHWSNKTAQKPLLSCNKTRIFADNTMVLFSIDPEPHSTLGNVYGNPCSEKFGKMVTITEQRASPKLLLVKTVYIMYFMFH